MDDKELLRLIDGYVNPELSEEDHVECLNALLLKTNSGALTIATIVQNMGDYLPNPDNIIRKRATLLLSELLARLPKLKLDTAAIHFLTGFFCDRLQDFPTIGEVLKALRALTTNHTLFEDDGLRIVQTISLEIIDQGYVASLSQGARNDLISTFSILLDKHPDKIRSLKADFVLAFIRVIDGERDPRNIVLNFQVFRKVIAEIPEYTAFTEELFEVVSVYFPITFRPKPNDPHGISREQLIDGLRNCFTATPAFGQFCIPFLLDKLSSNILETKLDAMDTLQVCIASYGGYTIASHLEDLWTALKNEVMTSKEGRVVAAAFVTITSICNTISVTAPSYLPKYLEPLIASCVSELKHADSKVAISCGKILQSAASGSVAACKEVFSAAFPPLLSQFEQENRPAHRKSLLDLIVNFLEPSKKGQFPEQEGNPLNDWKDSLFNLFVGVLVADTTASSTFKTTTIDGLTTLVTSGLLSLTQVELALQHLNKLLIEADDLMVRSQSLRALHTCAGKSTFTPLLEKHTLVALFNQLSSAHTQDTVKRIPKAQIEGEERKAGEGDDGRSAQWLLHSLAILSSNPDLCKVVIPKLISVIQEHWQGIQKVEASQIFVAAIFEAIASIVCPPTGDPIEASVLAALSTEYCPALLKLLVDESASPFATSCENSMEEDDNASKKKYYSTFLEILQSAVKIFRCVTQGLLADPDKSNQQRFVEQIADRLMPLDKEEEEGEAKRINPLHPSSPYLQKLLVLIFTHVAGSYHRDLVLPNVDKIIQQLLALTQTPFAQNEFERYDILTLSASQCIAAIINKLPDNDSTLAAFTKDTLPTLLNTVKDSQSPIKARTDALLTLSWLAKALVMRGNESGSQLSSAILQLLDTTGHEDADTALVARKAADAFDVIIGNTDHLLNTKSSTRIRILYKQKYFTFTLPELLKGFKAATPQDKPNYLFAVSNLLKYIEKSVLLSELPNILPLVVQAMSSTNKDLLLSTLQTLKMLIAEAQAIVATHLNSLIPNLLTLTKFKESMDVRILALDCLYELSAYPYIKIYPFRDQIVRDLKAVLDDPKRLVRRAAVKCSNQWFVLEDTDKQAMGKKSGCG